MSQKIKPQEYKIAWAAEHFGGLRSAIVAAKYKAIELYATDKNKSVESAMTFILWAGKQIHFGDCDLARSWDVGPKSCSACVYDDYMMRAWQALELELAPNVVVVVLSDTTLVADRVASLLEKRQTCNHSAYGGMAEHGRCCPNCGQFMVDFGD